MANKPKTPAKAPPKKPEAGKKTTEKSDSSRALARVKDNVPATDDEALKAMQDAMAGDVGRGVSTALSDNIVPLIYILQAQSPQALRQKAEYVPGAQAGMFWFRGTKTVVDGDEGIPAVLCHMSVTWIEWRLNRGGLVGRHGPTRPKDAEWVVDPKNPKRGQWELPNGNYVVETREHVLLLPETGDAYVLALSGSNHGAAKQWMTNSNRKRIPGTDLKAPLWGYVWRIKTIAKTNDDGDWFGLLVEEELNDADQHQPTWQLDGGKSYALARQLNEDFEAGRRQSDQGDELADGADTETTDEETDKVV